jgi:hypothetical protein
MVLTEDPEVAAWARGPFGSSRMPLRPVVFCMAEMPRQISTNDALENPLLAVLHAISYPDPATAKIALDVIQPFPDELRELSFTMIMNAQRIEYRGVVSVERLRELTLQVPLVKEVMAEEIAERCKEFQEKVREAILEAGRQAGLEAGRRDGLEEGRQQGRQQGRQEGRQQALEKASEERLAVLQSLAFELLRSKQLQLHPGEEERLRKADEATLLALIVDLGIAVEEAQLRAAVARCLSCGA